MYVIKNFKKAARLKAIAAILPKISNLEKIVNLDFCIFIYLFKKLNNF